MPEVDIERVSAIGKEAGGVPLLYAAVLDDRIGRLLLENVLVSYAAVVNPLGNKIPLEDVNHIYSEAGRVYRTSGAADSLRITRHNENDDSTTGAYLEWFHRVAGSG